MNHKTFESGMALLGGAFSDKNIDMVVFWELLKDMDDEEFLMSIRDICTTMTEIYPGTNLVGLIRENKVSNRTISGGEGWSEVMSEISRVGHYGTPTFTDAVTERAVSCIGWKTICISENIGVERAHFLKIYEQLKDRHIKTEKQLPEIADYHKQRQIQQLTDGVLKKMGAK